MIKDYNDKYMCLKYNSLCRYIEKNYVQPLGYSAIQVCYPLIQEPLDQSIMIKVMENRKFNNSHYKEVYSNFVVPFKHKHLSIVIVNF